MKFRSSFMGRANGWGRAHARSSYRIRPRFRSRPTMLRLKNAETI